MSAKMHAERFLAACPEDVRAAAERTDFGRGSYALWWGPNVDFYVNAHFSDEGTVSIFYGHKMPERVHPMLSVDRLLSGYTPEQNFTARTIKATASQTGQGGNFMGGETIAHD